MNVMKNEAVRRVRSRAAAELHPDPPKRGPQAHAAPRQDDEEHEPRRRLRRHVGDRRAADAHPGAEHERGREADAREVRKPDHDERRARVLQRPHPALRGGRHEHERRAERRDPHPQQRLRGRGRAAAGHRVDRRPGDELERDREHHPEAEGEPGGLDADVERLVDAARAVQARGARGRPVLEERAEPEHLREQEPREGQAGQRHGAQVADDGRVAQDVERLGDQGAERGDREREHLAVGRHPGRTAHPGSLAGHARRRWRYHPQS